MGRYDKGEPRSILVIDNASIHQHIRELIEHPDVGGKVIFTAPYRYVRYCDDVVVVVVLYRIR